ncbi:MAG: serine/threonine protein kinase [Fibrobacteria bacterium]|nr:serine/threonine protein kinase [Fibrobacteria bacterium]
MNAPAQIGRYLLEKEIGRGGAGTVWRAHDPLLQRTVALKLLSSGMVDGRDDAQRFLAEARAIARLVHQNIVVLYEYGSENGRNWLAMQCVEGQSLARLVTREGRLPVAKTVEIARQILRALRYAHGQHLLHRDVKSSNILLDDAGQALLGDFGIALLEDSDRLTTEGVALGTPEYMSPEQCQGHALDERSDLYSLGIVIHECLSGKPPFLAEAPLAIAYKHVHEPAPDLERSDVPPTLRAILRKALAKRPEDRFPSAAAMLEAFDALAEPKRTPTSGTPTLQESSEQRQRPDRRTGDRRRGPRRDTEALKLPWYRQPLLLLLAGVLVLLSLLVPLVGILVWKLVLAH